MKRTSVNYITRAASVAAMYTALSLVSNLAGLASGAVQLRLSEALCLMPVLFPESVWGIFLGCLISNLLTGCVIWDIILGSLVSLAGAYLTYKLRDNLFLASLPPFVLNTIALPFILKFAYSLGDAWWYLAVSIGLGEFAACCILAPMLIKTIKKHKGRYKNG